MFPRSTKASLAGLLSLAMGTLCATAQQAATDPGTIHVYVNRMQIPVLLLDSYRHPTKAIPSDRFLVELQGLAPVRPTRVRLQGDDPISLILLLDHSDRDEDWWGRLPAAAAALTASLNPDDHVEVYGMDGCNLHRYGLDAAISARGITTPIGNAAAEKTYIPSRHTAPCPQQPTSLWDSLLYGAGILQQRGGRRILLALTNGQRPGSDLEMNRLRQSLNMGSIALFAIEHGEGEVFANINSHILQGRESAASGPDASSMRWDETSLALESELSGGMVLTSSAHGLPHALQQVISLVRGRYVLEFPRPANMTAGVHSISVSVGNTRHFIRPSGISLPIASREEQAAEAATQHGRLGEPQASDVHAGGDPAATAPAAPVTPPAP